MLAFYSDKPSLNPAEAYSFSVKFVSEKNKNKQKEAVVGPFIIFHSQHAWQPCVHVWLLGWSGCSSPSTKELHCLIMPKRVITCNHLQPKISVLGGSLGLLVKGGDSQSEGCEFESCRQILDGHFFTLICCIICIVCLKRPKIS